MSNVVVTKTDIIYQSGSFLENPYLDSRLLQVPHFRLYENHLVWFVSHYILYSITLTYNMWN